MNELEKISLREYARRMGVSDTSVRKAIKAEKIVNGVVRDDKGTPYILPDIATAEWERGKDPLYGKREDKPLAPPPAVTPPAIAPPSAPSMDTSLAAAKRAQAVYKAKMMELEMKQKQGLLVDKKLVYSALFDAGKELRQAFEALPDRWIDQIISAAKDRNKAHLILTDAIQEVLGRLSEIDDRMNFEKR